MKTSVHQHSELDLYSVGEIEPVGRDKSLSNVRVLLTTRAAKIIPRCNLSVVTFGDPANTGGVAVVNARRHKRMDECYCWYPAEAVQNQYPSTARVDNAGV